MTPSRPCFNPANESPKELFCEVPQMTRLTESSADRASEILDEGVYVGD